MAKDIEILEDRSAVQPREPQIDAGLPEQVQFGRPGSQAIDAQQATHLKSKPRQRKRAVSRRAAESPATRIVSGEIS
jgi:4'-phosphopantetheinyl transferase EntD